MILQALSAEASTESLISIQRAKLRAETMTKASPDFHCYSSTFINYLEEWFSVSAPFIPLLPL